MLERGNTRGIGCSLPGFNGTVAQSLRRSRTTDGSNIQESQGQSWYNALQIKLGRRFTQGMQFDIAYTFSRLTGTAAEDLYGGTPLNAPQNPYERTRTVSPNSTPHVLVFNYILEVPFGKGRRYFNKGGFVNAILADGRARYPSLSSVVPWWLFQYDSGFLNTLGLAGFRGDACGLI